YTNPLSNMNYFTTIRIIGLLITVVTLSQCTQQYNKTVAESPKEILGPYIQRMDNEQVTIGWSIVEGETKISNSDTTVATIKQITNHQSIFTGIEPNTKYNYDILNDGSSKGKGTFRTFPREIEPFNFVVLGDTR